MTVRLMYLFLLGCWPVYVTAQQTIFPGLTGDDLLQALQGSYTPSTVLEYGPARDTLYTNIYNVNDTVYGVYTLHGIYLPDDVSPRDWLYRAGNPNGPGGVPDAINTEHVYPQSKGATKGTQGYSDMHHLFPSRLAVNEDRGSLPFGEIPDSETDLWYYKNQELTNIPSTNINSYSEGTTTFFEPRESIKGNVARAVFYFYTIYRQPAMNADPDFFENQRMDLCQWHMSDPADALELNRSESIALHQSGVQNPFVLDCSLAKRLYCPELSDSCIMVNTSENDLSSERSLRAFWNNAQELRLFYNGELKPNALLIYDIFGKQIASFSMNDNIALDYPLSVQLSQPVQAGMYIIQLQDRNEAAKRIQCLSLTTH